MSYLQERLSFDEKTLTETADSAVKYIKASFEFLVGAIGPIGLFD
jgi:hypothetical protein